MHRKKSKMFRSGLFGSHLQIRFPKNSAKKEIMSFATCGHALSWKISAKVIDIIYYYVIWTDNASMLLEANTRRQEGKYPTIKVMQSYIFKLLSHSVNSVPILYRTGNMQSAILLSFVTSSFLPSCGLQSAHLCMPCCISPYVVYNVCGKSAINCWIISECTSAVIVTL